MKFPSYNYECISNSLDIQRAFDIIRVQTRPRRLGQSFVNWKYLMRTHC